MMRTCLEVKDHQLCFGVQRHELVVFTKGNMFYFIKFKFMIMFGKYCCVKAEEAILLLYLWNQFLYVFFDFENFYLLFTETKVSKVLTVFRKLDD